MNDASQPGTLWTSWVTKKCVRCGAETLSNIMSSAPQCDACHARRRAEEARIEQIKGLAGIHQRPQVKNEPCPLTPHVIRKPPLRPIYHHLRTAALNTLICAAMIATALAALLAMGR
jgi:hypothetical protein